MESVSVFCTPILCDFRQFNWSAMLASVILFRCCSVLSWRHFLSGSTADQDQYQGTASQILGWICSVMYPLFMKVQNYSALVQENTWKKHAHTCTNPWNKIALLNLFFWNSFGPPVFWGSAWAASALAAQASAVRWSSRVRSVMGKIKEFYGNINIYDCFSEEKIQSTSQSKIPHLTSKYSASLVVWTLTLRKWGHFSELSFSRFPTPTSLRSRKPLLKRTTTSSLKS